MFSRPKRMPRCPSEPTSSLKKVSKGVSGTSDNSRHSRSRVWKYSQTSTDGDYRNAYCAQTGARLTAGRDSPWPDLRRLKLPLNTVGEVRVAAEPTPVAIEARPNKPMAWLDPIGLIREIGSVELF